MRTPTYLWVLAVIFIDHPSRSVRRLDRHYTDAEKAIVDNKSKVTDEQLQAFLDICWKKYVKAKIEPG